MKKHDVVQGLHLDIPEADYHTDPCVAPSLSASLSHVLLTRSPRHAWWSHPKLNPDWAPDEATNEQDFGRAVHALLLEGEIGETRICAIEEADYRKKEAQQARDAARASGMIPLLFRRWEVAMEMVKAARDQLLQTELAFILDDGDAELTAIWQEGPIWCRGRMDKVSADRKVIVDLKNTTASRSEE